MSQACLIESLWPATDCCCESGASRSEAPEESCAQCITLKTGANPTPGERIAAEMPALVEDVMGSAALKVTIEPPDVAPIWRMETPAESPPIWQLVARTSAPVRGPSFAA